ncbi:MULTISPECIES: efflux transporter outer membrane subunit [unclassified Agrobacterium]|jgi:NodT family efflux transporter outer membrane factor (OMF) lipoprotein|uniref:efflux transporter outer membrane subunit n=1 Tax=unclassified Agrobacterium TaxID=2632611 RepID=UPI002447FC02|nr:MULTISPECIES: efflux transporter outer membrane subunit [unclassified Agrobacterium]MDH0615400.1 efflux transporter outer membrane subunit [Agrobacterium sp. GD03872]MDH0698447.1 efflux transporter outer membrane subunit [Agrobacterium sp. GD03871]MDH1060626.1 efflux transporter outer membrane subunit [Agrobacterium sp. GD03992]MDH2213051.1 efflux transporter outer membrane subunit [Agrobacterium sp. GD03643]MDH2220861.1 efflux transporter outer membrane subunit [Agrobacterium sp. GD03638]
MRHPPFPALLASLSVAACTVGPSYVESSPAVAPGWISAANPHPIDEDWWRSFNDPQLVELVELAVTSNHDVREAEARLREARALRDVARGRAGPDAALSGAATANRVSENGQLPVANVPGFDPQFSLFDFGFDASWEIDLWGRTRRSIEAADARAEAIQEARRNVILQVIAEVVRSYVDLRGSQTRLLVARADANAQQAIASLVERRFRAGEASRFDFARADTQARAASVSLDGIEADARAAAYRLSLLTGQAPGATSLRLLSPGSLPVAPSQVTAGLPSELLRRRPDIRQAERELAAFTADVGVATADLFPRLSLIGSIGQQAQSAGDLASGASTRLQVGPSFHWPIFSMGRIRAQIRAADARADAAMIRYERSVTGALTDSETALNRYAAAQIMRRKAEGATTQAAAAVDLARQRYQAGEDDLTILLNAQSAYSAAERASLDARVGELMAVVALYKALGGGWEAAVS